jgi:hypothetical protein
MWTVGGKESPGIAGKVPRDVRRTTSSDRLLPDVSGGSDPIVFSRHPDIELEHGHG